MKKRIHVNQQAIKRNTKNETYDPVVTVKTYKENVYGHRALIMGPSEVVYPEKPLSCGARVFIETDEPVIVIEYGGETKRLA